MRTTDGELDEILTDGQAAYDASVTQLALDLRDAREQLRADARALWAVRVLDAWAGRAHPISGPYWYEGSNARYSGWFHPLMRNGAPTVASPDAARLAAAQAVFTGLPADVRAKLGECP